MEESCFTSLQESTTGALVSENSAAYFFFCHRGIVHYEFTPDGQTFNQDFYLAILRRLWDAV
jgi:hypothetical protein